MSLLVYNKCFHIRAHIILFKMSQITFTNDVNSGGTFSEDFNFVNRHININGAFMAYYCFGNIGRKRLIFIYLFILVIAPHFVENSPKNFAKHFANFLKVKFSNHVNFSDEDAVSDY